jgi:hypothetical protein
VSRRALRISALVAVLSCAAAAHAESPEQAYGAALASLAKGADNEAIDRLELLADQGFTHPDASLARAAAYLARAESKSPRPGDLGRAAAALSEALILRPDDAKAERALEAVQAEIARRKSRQVESVMVRPRLGRAIVTLLPEQAWASIALLGSLALAFGIVLRRVSTRGFARLAGAVAIGVGGALLAGFGTGAYAARQLRATSQPAVVVVPEARLLNESGRPLPFKAGADSTSVPEGATVYVKERREGRCLVEWGNTDGWLSLSDVRLLGSP